MYVFFVCQGATFCGQLLVGNFLSAGLGSSPIYTSLISVQSVTFAVYSSRSDAWYVAWQYVLDNNNHFFFHESHEIHFTNHEIKISDENGP